MITLPVFAGRNQLSNDKVHFKLLNLIIVGMVYTNTEAQSCVSPVECSGTKHADDTYVSVGLYTAL